MHALPVRRLASVLALAAAPAALFTSGAWAEPRGGGAGARTGAVSVRHDAQASPFPSNRLTVPDFGNATFRRVNLPLPDCTVRVSDCEDLAVINQLDGFSTQPRITVPFTGAIDLASVNSDTIYLLNLGDVLTGQGHGQRVGINQVLWDAASQTLVFEPDELLAERTRYLLVVTNGVRDAGGRPLRPSIGMDSHSRSAMASVRHGRHAVVAASLFTTQTATTDLVKIMRDIKARTPAPVDFVIGTDAAGAAVRTVFPVSGLAGIQLQRQNAVGAPLTESFLPTPALQVVSGAVGQVAYGRYRSPSYQVAGAYIPAVPTLNGRPQVQGEQELVFQLFLPAGSRPAGGWPVALFGHGFTDSMYGAPWAVASVFASRGIATLSINVVGHGGGAQGRLAVLPSAGLPVSLPAGGRGVDQDGNGVIDNTEGVNAAPPRSIISSRDGLRQTVVDLMQLVRQVEAGLDVDGDGSADLNAQRIYYAGQSFGGIYGTLLLGVEPGLQAGVPNVPGGSITEVARLGGFRFLTAVALATRQPQLLNLPPLPGVPVPFNLQFNENMPLRNLPAVVNNVPGAMDIAQVLDRFEWVQQSGNPVSYAHLIRQQPLRGSAAKPVILQMARGDTTVPNPTSSAIVRAGGLQAQTTYFRNDLAHALDTSLPKNPHTFLTNLNIPAAAPYAVGAQTQMAVFFQSQGSTVIDPDGAGPLFEVPIQPPLPEVLNFLP